MADIFGILRFAGDSRQDLVMTDTYQEIANVTLPGAVLGTYEYNMSITSTYDTANKSEFIRFSLDGGATWEEGRAEPGDSTDRKFNSYPFFRPAVSGDLSIIIQARKEDATGVMTIHFVNAWIKRIQ